MHFVLSSSLELLVQRIFHSDNTAQVLNWMSRGTIDMRSVSSPGARVFRAVLASEHLGARV